MIFAKTVGEAQSIPHGYGLAWRLPNRYAFVCLPVPMNVIARSFRSWWFKVKLPQGKDVLEECWQDGHRSGYAIGYKQGRETGLELALTLLEVRAELRHLH